MALFARIESGAGAAAGRQAAGQGSAGRCSFRRARLARKGKRVARRSDAGNRKIWRPNLPGMANKPLKFMAVSVRCVHLRLCFIQRGDLRFNPLDPAAPVCIETVGCGQGL